MKTRISSGLLLLALLPAGALASTDIDKSLKASRDGRVEIANVAGEVNVTGSDDDSVHVTGKLGNNTKELVFERDGDTVTIRVEIERDARNVGSTRLDIRVPEGSAVDIDTVSADVGLRDVHGAVHINTVSGDIELATATTNLDVTTMSGDLELRGEGQEGDIRMTSVSGNVTVTGLGGAVETSSVSGDVELSLGKVSQLHAKSTSGDVTASATLLPKARVDMESVSGDARLTLSGSTDGDYALNSFSGDVEACFGPKPETRRFSPGTRLNFTQGKGGPSIRASTMSGSVEICD